MPKIVLQDLTEEEVHRSLRDIEARGQLYRGQTLKVCTNLYVDKDQISIVELGYKFYHPVQTRGQYVRPVWKKWAELKRVKIAIRDTGLHVTYRDEQTKSWLNITADTEAQVVTCGSFLRYPVLQVVLREFFVSHGIEVPEEEITDFFFYAFPVFRLIEGFSPSKPYLVGESLKGYREAKTLQDLVRVVYGTYTKTHMKHFAALATRSALGGFDDTHLLQSFVTGAAVVRGLVPHEHLDRLDGRTGLSINRAELRILREILKRVRPNMRINFVDSTKSGYGWLEDSLLMYKKIRDAGLTDEINWRRIITGREFHDELVLVQRKIDMEDKPIPHGPLAKRAHNKTFGTFRIQAAERVHEVIEWGNEMHHCISAYTSMAVNGDTLLLGIYKENKLYANAMIKGGNLVQMYGKHNRNIDEHDYIVEELKKLGVLSAHASDGTYRDQPVLDGGHIFRDGIEVF